MRARPRDRIEMALSGVRTDKLCVEAFIRQKLGLKNGKKAISRVCYRLSDDGRTIEVENVVSKSGKTLTPTDVDQIDVELADVDGDVVMSPRDLWQSFRSQLPTDQCRYYTYDFTYSDRDGVRHEKLCFITWAPDTASIKAKMMIAASKEALKKALVGHSHEVQASDFDELEDYEDFATNVMHFR